MGRLVHLGDKKIGDNIGISYLIDILLQMSERLGFNLLIVGMKCIQAT